MKAWIWSWELSLLLVISARQSLAHEEGAPFSDAIVDPLILHHAHIENEERLNLFMLNRINEGESPGGQGYVSELELAYALPNHRYGFEVFIPVANLPALQGSGRVTGLQDHRNCLGSSTADRLSQARGIEAPVSGQLDASSIILLQIGNHLKWL